jgi:hypothetical protein
VSEYSPKYLPGDTITATTSGVVTGGQQLVVSGDGTVAASSAASAAWVGTALCDAASGALVTMTGRGPVHISTASGSITAGDQLVTATAGKVAALAAATGDAAADINSARSVVGVALTTAASAAAVEWMQV